jgi:DNA-binding LytR/AlgR family response regulator
MIVDDEPLARKGLQEYCAEVDFLELVAVCDSPVKAVALLQTQPVHLLFLDIQMPRINGLDLLRSLPQPPLVVFTTAFPEYALQGFELNVIDYLLKPIAFERFLKAALKARSYFELLQRPAAAEDSAGYFFIKCDNGLERICFDDILYAAALQNYVVLYTLQRKYITYLTFKAVEDYLPEQQFLRVHKSYIVALSKIERIAGSDIMIGPHAIPISRHLKEEVMERILRDRYLKR